MNTGAVRCRITGNAAAAARPTSGLASSTSLTSMAEATAAEDQQQQRIRRYSYNFGRSAQQQYVSVSRANSAAPLRRIPSANANGVDAGGIFFYVPTEVAEDGRMSQCSSCRNKKSSSQSSLHSVERSHMESITTTAS